MVSQLSSRLLAGYSPTGSVHSSSSSSSCSSVGTSSVDHDPHKAPSRDGQSGYSADKESSAAAAKPFIFNIKPPGHIDLRLKSKRKPTDIESREKRRKMEEANYKATTVRADLERAGLTYPTVRVDKPRAIPLAKNLDMSRVTLVSAKSVSGSPFLAPVRTTPAVTHDIVTDYGTFYSEVLESCWASYHATSQTEKLSPAGSDAESTSSVSDSESDDSIDSKILVVTARLDDALPPKAEPRKKEAPALTSVIACPPSMSMTMEEAMGVCDAARIITTSSFDHCIVHTNAAYSQLTEVHLHTLKGRPLCDALASGTPRKLSLACCAAASSEGRHERVVVVCRKAKSSHLQLLMKVTPIMPSTNPIKTESLERGDLRDLNGVTHFCIDLIDELGGLSSGDDASSEEEDAAAVPPSPARAIG